MFKLKLSKERVEYYYKYQDKFEDIVNIHGSKPIEKMLWSLLRKEQKTCTKFGYDYDYTDKIRILLNILGDVPDRGL